MAETQASDKPGVIAFPGVLYAAAFAAAYGLHLLWPVHLLPPAVAQWAGVALCLVGAALILSGVLLVELKPLNPWLHPSK